jgi:Na+-driven multidrug efflux pump
MGAVGTIFSEFIVSFFSTDKEVIAIGAERLAMIMPFFVFCSLMDVAAGQLRGMGESFKPMIVSLLGGCGIRLFWIFAILPYNHTLMFLYWAYPISWVATFIVQFSLYFILRNRIFRENI